LQRRAQESRQAYVPLSEESKRGFGRYRVEMGYLAMRKAAKKDPKFGKAV